MMLRLPLAAPSGPPETGASRKETPAAAEAACSCRANSTLTCMHAGHVHGAHATCGAAREVHMHAHAVQEQVQVRARRTVPASMSNEPGAATLSSPRGPRKTDRSAASPATETTTVEVRLHSSSRLRGWVNG
jgi:hypothetical protein